MVKRKNIPKQKPIHKSSVWRNATLFLGIICIILISADTMEYRQELKMKENLEQIAGFVEDKSLENVCSRITGTPSWANEDGTIIQSGYKDFGENKLIVVDQLLIPEQIYFIWTPTCSWCQKQINDFGETWQRYVDAGLTIDCSKQ